MSAVHRPHRTAARTLNERLHPLAVDQSVHLALGTHLQHIRFLALDREIAERFRPIPSTLQTIAGLGPVLEARIRSELGPIERFENDGKLAKFAGLVWRNYQPGKFDA